MLNNSHLLVFNPIQVQHVTDDIMWRIFCRKSARALILVNKNDFFDITDIRGCGLRRTQNSIFLTCLEPGDTVYFTFTYAGPKQNTARPSMVFQMRLRDADGLLFVRTACYNFSLVNNMTTLFQKMNYDVTYASLMLQCIDHGRENNDDLTMQDEVENLRDQIIFDNFIKLLICSAGATRIHEFESFFAVIKKLVNYVRSAEIMSKTPLDYMRFILPYGFLVMLGSNQVEGPIKLHKFTLQKGALLIQINNDHTVLLLADSEDINQWAASVAFPPLSDIIAQYSTARSLEVMHSKTSGESKVFVTLMKCMTAPIEQQRKKTMIDKFRT